MRGTTKTAADAFTRKSNQARSATGGNKNLQSQARRKSAASQVPSGRTTPLKGPDKGTG